MSFSRARAGGVFGPTRATTLHARTYVTLAPELVVQFSSDRERARLAADSMGESTRDYLIITAASQAFGPSLLALLGSLTLNWPNHPPVLVYDIGLDELTLRLLESHRIPVRKVPAFCPHWRQHFTWKIWCLNDAPAANVLWADAGLAVLRPLDEILDALDGQGYFFTTNYESLEWEASLAACEGCGVPADFRNGKLTLPGGLMGFRKAGATLRTLEEALSVARVERHIAATEVSHRHDQAIISLLAYKNLGRVVVADGTVYMGSLSPRQVPGQKVWVHRRKMLRADGNHFAAHVTAPGEPYEPSAPYPLRRARSLSHLYKVQWNFGRGELSEAREHLEMSFAVDATLKDDVRLVAGTLHRYDQRLRGFLKDDTAGLNFTAWALKQLEEMNGSAYASRLTNFLRSEFGARGECRNGS